MTRRPFIRSLLRNCASLTSAIAAVTVLNNAAVAQSAFSPAILVNDSAVSYYELDQRARLLTIMNAPGDPGKLAREQLIEDRLKLQAARLTGIAASDEGIQNGLDAFAARVNMEAGDLIEALVGAGIDEETLRDFIISNITWRGVIQSRFGGNAQVSEEEIDRAIAQNSGSGGVRVLLNEIIIPVTPQNQRQVLGLAEQLSEIRSFESFENAARTYSASATKESGGRVDWMNVTNLPAELRPVVTALRPGEVTRPLPLQNAVALFQLRDVAETGRSTPTYSAIDYMMYFIPGGRTEETLAQANELAGNLDRCDDLFAIAQDEPAEFLVRETLPPSDIPKDVAIELAKLDENEVSTNLTSADGQNLMVLMLCGRTAQLAEELSREDVAQALRNQRLESYANSYLSQLRAQARIIEK
ncbi:peptidylprolyl isomerase [Shimia sp. MMG029]|uniref:peptidylprolyl isomerase n=1 Tax=Shimia sp. MMG029 TaxID=3021978 RepID=UPI0022FE79B0|nr:peptidylprolyl isomerase [Shimia sp. MMG029]MDA5555894.1 peptidylprolyl isomerase [Shimia sp. MMG029]